MSREKNKVLLKRLKGKNTISFLFEKGKNIHSAHLSFKVVREEKEDCFYAGVSVPKRNFKLAVDRNRIKRQLREALKQNEMSLSFAGCGMLLYKSKKHLPTSILVEETASIFEQLNAKKDN